MDTTELEFSFFHNILQVEPKKEMEYHIDVVSMELVFEMKDFTAQFVGDEQYQHLLYILGIKPYSSGINQQSFKEILKFFQDFSLDNVKI